MKEVLSWGVFVLVLLGVYVLAGPNSLGGPASYVIVDGRSMEPTYEHGDLVVAYDRDGYDVGDIIVYDAPVDSQFNVIHRITERTDGGFITQGDNRDEPDGWIAPYDQIYGSALFHIPRGGQAVLFLRQPTTILAIGAGWITLILMRRREDDDGKDSDDLEADDLATSSEEGDTPVDTSDESLTRRSGAIATRHSRAVTMRAKRARSRTVALLTVAVLIVGTAGVLVAHAATLHVNAGVLQVFSEKVDIDIPEPETHQVTVQAHFFDSSNQDDEAGKEIGSSPYVFEPVEITDRQTYTIAWNGRGNSSVIECENEELVFHDGLPDHDHSGEYFDDAPVTPTGDVTHLLCIQTAQGNVPSNIDFHVSNGDGYHVTLTPVDKDEVACKDEDDGDCPDGPATEGNLDDEEELADDTPDDLRKRDGGPHEDDADGDTDPSRDQEDGKEDDVNAGQEDEGDIDAEDQDDPGDGQANDETDDSDDEDDLDDTVDADDEFA